MIQDTVSQSNNKKNILKKKVSIALKAKKKNTKIYKQQAIMRLNESKEHPTHHMHAVKEYR